MTKPPPETCYLQSGCHSIPGMKRFSHEAMATTFEILLVHEDDCYARQAAAAAFDEVDRLEAELSRFIENSDISRINNLSANQPLLIGLAAFECLQLSARIYAETSGAFDITIGSLLNCWRNEDASPRTPSQEELNLARQHTGTGLLKLDEVEHTVELLVAPVQVDLGGIGKGYAVDRMAELLHEWGVETALISGGYSSVLALDAPAGTKGWPVTLSDPPRQFASQTRSSGGKRILARLYLQGRAGSAGQDQARPPRQGRRPCQGGSTELAEVLRRALSGSGLQKGRHIIDPRTAWPVKGKRAAWASATDAATADALSTAFMVMTPDEVEKYCLRHPEVLAMIILEDEGKAAQKNRILRFGPWK